MWELPLYVPFVFVALPLRGKSNGMDYFELWEELPFPCWGYWKQLMCGIKVITQGCMYCVAQWTHHSVQGGGKNPSILWCHQAWNQTTANNATDLYNTGLERLVKHISTANLWDVLSRTWTNRMKCGKIKLCLICSQVLAIYWWLETWVWNEFSCDLVNIWQQVAYCWMTSSNHDT